MEEFGDLVIVEVRCEDDDGCKKQSGTGCGKGDKGCSCDSK